MSCTEIVGLTKNKAYSIGETYNSWRGAMAVWNIFEKRHLPKFIPEWAKVVGIEDRFYSRFSSGNLNEMKPVWELVNSDKVSFDEKIVLCTTFDNVLVRVENVDKVLRAFRKFDKDDGETSLKEQADVISEALKEDSDIIAIGWNVTSVNENVWTSPNYDEEKGETLGYNLEEDTGHWFLFDELKENESKIIIQG